jgi:hypothetical protein
MSVVSRSVWRTKWAGLAVAFLLLGLSAGAAEASSLRLGGQSSPHAFGNDLRARLISASDLWLAVAGEGRNPRASEVRVYSRGGHGWRRDRGLRVVASPDEQLLGGAIRPKRGGEKRRPCVGYTTPSGRPSVTCRRDGRWHPLAKPQRLGRFGRLVDMRTAGPGLLLLFQDTEAKAARVVRARANGRLTQVGAAAPIPRAITFLGLHGPPTILVQESHGAARYVLGLEGRRWHRRTAELRGGDGPLVGGNAELGGDELIPVVEANHHPWIFSAQEFAGHKWSGDRLSTGSGDAQGNLAQPVRRVWAIWQENRYARGSFDTRIRISRYSRGKERFGPAATLYAGLSPGPGDLQVARWDGHAYALYMRPDHDGERTLHAYVRRVG